MAPRRTPDDRTTKKQAFLKALGASGNITLSARAAGSARSVVYEWREKDEAFGVAWDEALAEAADVIEGEIYRRAVDGVEEGIYYQGKKVDVVRRYDSLLLIFLAKACNRRRFDPPGYVQLAIHEELNAKLATMEERLDAVLAQRSELPAPNPER
ncbi:MAG: hypothetical protein O2782_23050 [bacterium]|nr:hypothetical protein [bacterium]